MLLSELDSRIRTSERSTKICMYSLYLCCCLFFFFFLEGGGEGHHSGPLHHQTIVGLGPTLN